MRASGSTELTAQLLPKSSRYAHIDAMRAVAVLFVVAAHAGLENIVPGGTGVTIFFAISGFVITVVLLREYDTKAQFRITRFYIMRLTKLAPPFIVVVLIPAAFLVVTRDLPIFPTFLQTFFAFNWLEIIAPEAAKQITPGTGVVWSLAIEEQFYLVASIVWLAAIHFTKPRRTLVILAFTVVLYSSGARIYFFLTSGSLSENRIYFGSDTRADGIAIGVLAALYLEWLRRSDRRMRAWGNPLILVGAIIIMMVSLSLRDEAFRATLRYTLQSIATAMVILYGFNARGRIGKLFNGLTRNRLIGMIGLASYSIYLAHLPLIEYIQGQESVIPANGLPLTGLLIALSATLGIFLYKMLEIPAERLRHNLPYGREKKTLEAMLSSTLREERTFSGAANVIGCLLAVAAFTGMGIATTHWPTLDRATSPRYSLVVGDSFSNGAEGVASTDTYVVTALKELNYRVLVAGHGGTGFVRADTGGGGTPSLTQQILSGDATHVGDPQRVSLVVLQGGINDLGVPEDEIQTSAAQAINALKVLFPDARVVLLGPTVVSDKTPSDQVEAVSGALARAARSQEVPFVDETDWFWGRAHTRYLAADGFHPSLLGHQYMETTLLSSGILGAPQ